jgi:hypothetical protein
MILFNFVSPRINPPAGGIPLLARGISGRLLRLQKMQPAAALNGLLYPIHDLLASRIAHF